MWQTFVTTSDYCALNNSVPHCTSGAYLKDQAVAGSNLPSAQKIKFKPSTQEMNARVEARRLANMYVNTIDLQFTGGIVQNHPIALIESQTQMLVYLAAPSTPFLQVV